MQTERPLPKKVSLGKKQSFTRCNSEKTRKSFIKEFHSITNTVLEAKRTKSIAINDSSKLNIPSNQASNQTNINPSSSDSSISSQSSCSSSPLFSALDNNSVINPRQIDLKIRTNNNQELHNNITFELDESVDHPDSISYPIPNRKNFIGKKSPHYIVLNNYAVDSKELDQSNKNYMNYNTAIEKILIENQTNSNIFRSTPNLASIEQDENTETEITKSYLTKRNSNKNDLVQNSNTSMSSSLNSIITYNGYNYTQPGAKRITQRFKLIVEGDVQICKVQNSKKMLSKLLNSKLLRRWKTQHIVLTDTEILSTIKTDNLDSSIPYHSILEIIPISKWEPGQKYCLRISTIEGHYLFQTSNIYLRDQWIHSINWKKHKFKSERTLMNASRPEVLMKEINHMIEMSLTIPIDDSEIYQCPLEIISEILQKHQLPKQIHEEVIVCLSPLLEKNHPSPEICDFFSKHCRDSPRSKVVIEMFSQVVQRILKHNGDFGRNPRMRHFIQDYLIALMSQNAGLNAVQSFVMQMHSTSSQCPFPRVLPNFVSVCLASIHGCFETHRLKKSQQPLVPLSEKEREDQLICHVTMMNTMSTQEDWRIHLSQLLQSVPFPDQALSHKKFIEIFKNVVKNFAQDSRCEVHQTLLGIREGKEGWLEIFCPGGMSCNDDGEMFTIILQSLIGCCCKKKRFLLSINKLLPHILVLATREVPCAIDSLCAMLDLDGLDNTENIPTVIKTLQSTMLGLKMYAKVCERQIQLKELQQKGGPRKLTLPSRSTDEDLSKILLSGSFGNLECLSLAFTNVTSACAEYLIKLPSLRYLNLWSTKFGDQGLELISEHLQRLQVLNLCETPVTDKGLACLASMKQLRKLNLNSTNLSALTFEGLKECLPALQECDIRYTDAW